MNNIKLTINAQSTYQKIEGFGANINPVGHWREGALRPALDVLIDDLGASMFRLDPYGFSNWVDPDDKADRSILNAETYARVYRSQPFLDAWEMARYITSKGARFILNVSGVVPRWMCAEDGKTLVDQEAYAELLTSLAWWARNKEGLAFELFGPFNETDLGPPEGPIMDPANVARTLALTAAHFDAAGLSDLKFVAVDQGRYNLDFLQALLAEPSLREKIAIAGLHCYSDIPLNPARDFIAENKLNWSYWLSEYGDLDQTGEQEWEVAVASTRRLLRGLNEGVQGAMVWDAYDNWHGHDASWSIYGILRVGSRWRYTPKKRYYAAKHVYRFVPAGSARVEVTREGHDLSLAAFRTPGGGYTLVGLNEGEPVQLDVQVEGFAPEARPLKFLLTDRNENCREASVARSGENLQLHIPGESIFTLTTLHG